MTCHKFDSRHFVRNLIFATHVCRFTWNEPEGFRQSYSDQLVARDPVISVAMRVQRVWRASQTRKKWSHLLREMARERKRRQVQAEASASAEAAAQKRKKRRPRPSEIGLQSSSTTRADEQRAPVGSPKVLNGVPDTKFDIKTLGAQLASGTANAAVRASTLQVESHVIIATNCFTPFVLCNFLCSCVP